MYHELSFRFRGFGKHPTESNKLRYGKPYVSTKIKEKKKITISFITQIMSTPYKDQQTRDKQNVTSKEKSIVTLGAQHVVCCGY